MARTRALQAPWPLVLFQSPSWRTETVSGLNSLLSFVLLQDSEHLRVVGPAEAGGWPRRDVSHALLVPQTCLSSAFLPQQLVGIQPHRLLPESHTPGPTPRPPPNSAQLHPPINTRNDVILEGGEPGWAEPSFHHLLQSSFINCFQHFSTFHLFLFRKALFCPSSWTVRCLRICVTWPWSVRALEPGRRRNLRTPEVCRWPLLFGVRSF